MDKSVIDPAISGALEPAESAEAAESARTSGSGLPRRRRRKHHHHRHQNLNKRSGKGVEIAFVTLLALGILFGVMYYFIERYEHRNDETSQRAPSHRGVSAEQASI
jgi:hypothetical protein